MWRIGGGKGKRSLFKGRCYFDKHTEDVVRIGTTTIASLVGETSRTGRKI
jgi:hypothetical protein